MKFAAALTTLAVITSASAIAISAKREAEPEPEPWCDLVGQPCWKVKRAADAFADALSGFSSTLAARDPEAVPSDAEGYHAFMAKRAVDHLANVVAVARSADPAAYYAGLGLEKKFAVEPAPTKRDASPEPWCDLVGQPCWKRAVREDKRWCDLVGQPCWKAKRAAEAVISSIGDIKEREAEPEPWCDLVGQPCWKAKRDAAPEATPWCDLVGQPCWKGRRDLHAMQSAARSVLDALA